MFKKKKQQKKTPWTFGLDVFCGHGFVGNVRSYNHAL